VVVEHVHVHSGGQAVIGVVEPVGGWGSRETGGSRPCKANCPCTAASDVERGREAGPRAGRPRWRMAAAECMEARRRAHQRVIGTP
jgi:hypothetical protein